MEKQFVHWLWCREPVYDSNLPVFPHSAVVVSVQLPLRVCNFSRGKNILIPIHRMQRLHVLESQWESRKSSAMIRARLHVWNLLQIAVYYPVAEAEWRGNLKAWIDCTKFWIVKSSAQVHSSGSTHWVRGSTLCCVVVSSPRCHRHPLLLLLYTWSSMTHSIHECNRKLR